MNQQTKISIALGVVLALVIGLGVGYSIAKAKPGQSGVHMMSDGSMMMNHNNQSGSMASIMHDMNASLEGKTRDAFDKAFLEEMVVHHIGAVDMAKKVLEVSQRPELIKLANEIIAAQTKEIEMMNQWKVEWFK